jgi:metallo-beta-lactamase family protein
VSFRRPIEIAPGVTVELVPVGHLLGSAYVVARLSGGRTILFGGDLGRYGRPVMPDPADPVAADVVLVESTYGDRDHATDDDGEVLSQVIRDTVARGGKVIVPAFAIGRVEELLYWIGRLERERRIPVVPVYVDSPMAVDALKFYAARTAELDPDIRPTSREVRAFATARFQTVPSPQQSKALTASKRSSIVISASGMATGGRVLHHLAAALPDPRNTVLFAGYQAEGTRGRQLIEGAAEVRIHGRSVAVHASVKKINSMSAHADRSEIVRWLGAMPARPERLCLVHGEPAPMDRLKAYVHDRLGWDATTPNHGETIPV